MSSILVYGSTKPARQDYVEALLESLEVGETENNPDFLTVDKEEKKRSIGIGQVRVATKFLSEKPFSHANKVVVINNAETLTTQAQNALLKTLEEHPSYATIILNSKTEDSLLQTVVSRCKRIRVNDIGKIEVEGPTAAEVLTKDTGEKLAWAADFAKEDREVMIETLEDWVIELRNDLNETSAHNITTILKIKKDLENTNVTLKLALENLMLKTK